MKIFQIKFPQKNWFVSLAIADTLDSANTKGTQKAIWGKIE